ncbi:hypothetical protein NE237_012763 [Protea cynaroides]|uniref:Uncharacterized protein n=1 Tax=Protea cynaroides TaxID=273540 RepID=A0A9Q0GYN2_9MAGN|nr:hypothetical protein NE237_012763 [Protea cynaroides]
MEADMMNVWKHGTCRIKGQGMRFQRWTPGFNVNNQNLTYRLQWIRWLDLPYDYLEQSILFSIVKTQEDPVAPEKPHPIPTRGKETQIQAPTPAIEEKVCEVAGSTPMVGASGSASEKEQRASSGLRLKDWVDQVDSEAESDVELPPAAEPQGKGDVVGLDSLDTVQFMCLYMHRG